MIPQEIADAARGLVGHVGWDAYMAFVERQIDGALKAAITEEDISEVRKHQGRYEAYQSMVGWLDRALKAGEEATRNLERTA